jgi:hypothetical protein
LFAILIVPVAAVEPIKVPRVIVAAVLVGYSEIAAVAAEPLIPSITGVVKVLLVNVPPLVSDTKVSAPVIVGKVYANVEPAVIVLVPILNVPLTVVVDPVVEPILIVVVPLVAPVPMLIAFVTEVVTIPVAIFVVDAKVAGLIVIVPVLIEVPPIVIVPDVKPVPTENDPVVVAGKSEAPSKIVVPLIFKDVAKRLIFSDEVQPLLTDVQLNVLSLAPLRVIPPPAAVTSVAPPTENVIDPIVFAVAEVIVICVDESTLVIVVDPPKAPAPDDLVSAIPGIIPIVDVNPVTVVVVVIAVIVPVTEAIDVTDPNSIFLSSTIKLLELIVVVIPFTVRFPPTITLPLVVNAAKFVVPVKVGDSGKTRLVPVPVYPVKD